MRTVTAVTLKMRRAVWLACVSLVLAATSAFAAPVVGDFDGDGQRDRATFSRREPSVLRVWLSTTHTVAILHARSPILALAARDLDGDRRDELIASGASGLQIWTRPHQEFAPLHPRHRFPAELASEAGHTVDEGPRQYPAAVPSAGASLLALVATPRVYGGDSVSIAPPGRLAGGASPVAILAPFAPRPPPLAL